jgi:hypothetical protein
LDQERDVDLQYRGASPPIGKGCLTSHVFNVGMIMSVNYLLWLATRCRDLEATAIEPEVIEQLKIWATELAEMADDVECRAVQHGMAE